MTLKQRAMKLAEKLGVDIDGYPDKCGIDLTTPPGKVFSATCTHATVHATWDLDTAQHVWRSVISDLEYGIEDCEDPDCDTCHEETCKDPDCSWCHGKG